MINSNKYNLDFSYNENEYVCVKRVFQYDILRIFKYFISIQIKGIIVLVLYKHNLICLLEKYKKIRKK